jgi:hypothetical protein
MADKDDKPSEQVQQQAIATSGGVAAQTKGNTAIGGSPQAHVTVNLSLGQPPSQNSASESRADARDRSADDIERCGRAVVHTEGQTPRPSGARSSTF